MPFRYGSLVFPCNKLALDQPPKATVLDLLTDHGSGRSVPVCKCALNVITHLHALSVLLPSWSKIFTEIVS